MSSTLGQGATQRVTRASSRASSRAGSEGPPSIAEESNLATNAGRRGNTATSKTARITNRSSGAYGARGKPQSAPAMSASGAANPASQEILSAVHGAQVNAALANNLADTLPPPAEERTLQPLAEEHLANQDQSGQGQEPATGETTFLDRFDISAILPRGMAAPRPVQNARPVLRPEANQTRRAAMTNSSFVTLMLLYVVLSMLSFYLVLSVGGPFGNPVPSDVMTIKAGNRIIARVEKLEMAVHQLASQSSAAGFPDIIHQVNWFAPANGAVVNPRLSSPVYATCQDPKSLPWYERLMGASRCTPASHMHGQALRPWSEPDDFFCAAPSGGRLQLGVIVQRPVAPTELIIEHIPRSAALHIGSAPKDVELWVKLPDTVVRRSVLKALALDDDGMDVLDGPSAHVPESEKALYKDYRRIGRWTYNIWKDHHIQGFQIAVDLQDLGVKVTDFALRVYSNWEAEGRGPVCIYRARLHGHDMSGIVEQIQPDPPTN